MPPIYRCYAGRVEKLTLDALDRETAQKKGRCTSREETASCDGLARQKQRALVLVFLSNFPVIHLPLNTK